MLGNSIDIYVGTRLKVRRNELGLSQDKVGKMTGVTFQQIQKYEKGANRIGASRLYELAKILGVPIGYFFEYFDEVSEYGEIFDSSHREESNDNGNISNEEVVTLIRNFSSIRDLDTRRGIITLSKTLAKSNKEEKKCKRSKKDGKE